MVAIVSVETVLLVLLVLLVAGLLRSHAEILRRLESGESRGPESAPRRKAGAPAPAIAGTTTEGDAVTLDFAGGAGPATLLAFLSTGCSTCAGMWEGLGERRLPDGVQTVIVAHGAERERAARLRSLATGEVPVVMSSAAWEDYGVPGAPYFVLVDGDIRGEGTATTWEGLASLVSDAIEDVREAMAAGRGRRVDDAFAAAGIGPDDPSLYPAGRSSSTGSNGHD
jgi:hypothetical protein